MLSPPPVVRRLKHFFSPSLLAIFGALQDDVILACGQLGDEEGRGGAGGAAERE